VKPAIYHQVIERFRNKHVAVPISSTKNSIQTAEYLPIGKAMKNLDLTLLALSFLACSLLRTYRLDALNR